MMSLLCVFSCEKHEAELDINTLIVSGAAYDSESGEPVPNVTVYLMGYAPDDEKMEKNPLSTDIAYTSDSGTYKFTKLNPVATLYYKIVAVDNDPARNASGAFQTSLKFLYLSEGTSYFSRSKTYELKNIDFYLTK